MGVGRANEPSQTEWAGQEGALLFIRLLYWGSSNGSVSRMISAGCRSGVTSGLARWACPDCARGRRRFACVRNVPLLDRGRDGRLVDGRGNEATGRLDTNRRPRLDSRPVSALGPRSGASHQGFRAMLVSFEKTNGWRAQGIADRKT